MIERGDYPKVKRFMIEQDKGILQFLWKNKSEMCALKIKK